MSAVVVGSRAYLKDILGTDSPLLEKIQNGSYEMAISKAIERAYYSAFRKHGMTAIIPERRIMEVNSKLVREKKLIVMNDSQITSKTKKLTLKGIMNKYAKFVKLAIASSASHLVTYAGEHLKLSYDLDKCFGINVLSPSDFIDDP